MTTSSWQRIRELGAQHFEQLGFASLQQSYSLPQYRQWLDEGKHGSMSFLREHLAFKEQPQRLHPRLQSAIVASQSYFPHPRPLPSVFTSPHIKVATYAQGEDYHHWFKKSLQDFADILQQIFPDEVFVCFTDSGPVLERDLAYQAGLGWVGKNTCLIHQRRGSLFFIGEILTSLSLSPDRSPHPDRCGNCNRCIEACPTGALSDKSLDANLCISYLSIENKAATPTSLQQGMGPWFYGCDICQAVCPWNEKLLGQNFLGSRAALGAKNAAALSLEAEDRKLLMQDLRSILSASNKALQRRFASSPMNRASGNQHKRNALRLVLYFGLNEMREEIQNLLQQSSWPEWLRQTATWVLEELEA